LVSVYIFGKEINPMQLDKTTSRLIAIGASVSANCQPCLQINAANAIEEGITEQAIAEAVGLGKMVRQGAASKMDKFIVSLSAADPVPTGGKDGGCGCST
jgi:AhpD family alkylhydroperoxidase